MIDRLEPEQHAGNTAQRCGDRGIVLASRSPFRKALLARLKLEFTTASPDIDESPLPGETAVGLATRLSRAKAQALSKRFPKHLIIGSDQVAMHGTKQLEKPANREKAIEQLRRVSGGRVCFHTGVCVFDSLYGRHLSGLESSVVYFRALTTSQIERYVQADRPYECAGGFKVESLGIALCERIESEDPNSLIGLPLMRLVRMLEAFGVEVI
jgi:septum formation protein